MRSKLTIEHRALKKLRPTLPSRTNVLSVHRPRAQGVQAFRRPLYLDVQLRRPMITTEQHVSRSRRVPRTPREGSGPPFETAINRTANPIPSHPSESQIRLAWCNHTGNNVNSQAASGSSQVRVTVANRKRTWKTPGRGERKAATRETAGTK